MDTYLTQGLAKPDLESQDLNQDLKNLGHMDKTETFSGPVSRSGPRSRLFCLGLNIKTKSETPNFKTETVTQMKVVKTIMDKTDL